MGHDIKTFREAAALLLRVWRESRAFFLSIELWLMVLVAGATVGGAWLAVMGGIWSVPAFGFALGYGGPRTAPRPQPPLAAPAGLPPEARSRLTRDAILAALKKPPVAVGAAGVFLLAAGVLFVAVLGDPRAGAPSARVALQRPAAAAAPRPPASTPSP